MRKLKTSDIFKMSKILKKMGLKINTENATQKQAGADLILSVFENLHLAEKEVKEFLADLMGMSSTEFAELPFERVFEIIKDFKQMSGIESFLKSANQ
jgi:predicted transcriptional regulator